MSAEEASDLADVLSDLYDDKLLNDAYERLMDGDVAGALKDLETGLNDMLLDSSDPEWNGFVQFCRAHPIRGLLHQDPFTLRAYEKPRGYAGDPGLLDFVYGVENGQGPPDGTTELGCRIFEYTTRTVICDGLRARAHTVAEAIDCLANQVDRPDILSLAAGHLREAHLSEALKRGQIGRWLALDSDAETLEEIRQMHTDSGVETLAATVRQILAGKSRPGQFDLIYSTGLFGNLEQSTGKRLTKCLFDMLRPGGRLMIANFSPEMPERGYMESYMDWRLTCRSRHEIKDLAADVHETQLRDVRLLAGDNPSIVFLSITKN
jgi:hypothetical protein